MARYLNVWSEKHIVISKAYDTDFGKWICEHGFMVAVETDKGDIKILPVMNDTYLEHTTAEKYLEEAEDEEVEILENLPWKIEENITEWICNESAVSGSRIHEAICVVVALLTKYGMWNDRYAKFIDIDKIERKL